MDKSEDDKSIICIHMGHRNLRLDMFDIRELREYIEHRGSFCRHDPAAYGIGPSYAIKHRPILDNNDEYLDLYTERRRVSCPSCHQQRVYMFVVYNTDYRTNI